MSSTNFRGFGQGSCAVLQRPPQKEDAAPNPGQAGTPTAFPHTPTQPTPAQIQRCRAQTEPLQRSAAWRAGRATTTLMGLACSVRVAKQKARCALHGALFKHAPARETAATGFIQSAPVSCTVNWLCPCDCVTVSVCVKVLFEKKIYTPVVSVSRNPFFTITVHILQGHFLIQTQVLLGKPISSRERTCP